MTSLVGTKTPSAPVGDKSGGERRAARAFLSCSSWRVMGRLWRGMGGMGRAEPLPEHHPHQQHDHSGFHGSRETSQETRNADFDSCSGRHGSARVASRKTAARSLLSCALWRGMGRLWRGMGGTGRPVQLSAHPPHQQQGHSSFHETRDPRPETRLFFESRPFCRVGRQVMREGGQARRLQGWTYETRENEWKGVFLNPETGITTFSESRFGSRFGIRHNSSQFVGKIRISPCRPSSAPAHCGKLAVRGKSPVEGAAGSCGRSARSEEDGDPGDLLRRTTKLTSANVRRPKGYAPLPVNGTEGAAPCSWNDQAILHRAPERNAARVTFTTGYSIGFMDASRPRLTFPGPQVSPSGDVKGERATNRETQPLTRRAAQASPSSEVFTKHETRNTKHGFFSKHGFFLACFGRRMVRNAA